MRVLILLFLCLQASFSFAQGINNLWMMGYESWAGIPYGGTTIDFSSSSAHIYLVNREMNIARTHSNITNSNGDVLFYTNGIYIANRTGAMMANGNGLNPSWFTDDQAEYGLAIPQAALIIPKPDDEHIYYLFHSTADEPTYQTAKSLYLTTINMQLSGGLGAVTAKNQPLVTQPLNTGKIAAVKHGNGRDWWVFCHKAYTDVYYRFLVTQEGISGPVEQSIGSIRPDDVGQVAFSPDGSRFAYYYPAHGLDVMNFDRCSGLFSNPVHISVSDTAFDGGVAFSPNSQMLYVPSTYFVYQYNLASSDIASTKQTVAVWDGFYDPEWEQLKTIFSKSELAPDGKIYISTGNSTRYLHVINNPDEVGVACNLVQHGVVLQTFNFNSLPNHPNYHLGPLSGSPCDTLVSATEPLQVLNLQLYPNPNNGEFSISFAPQPEQGELLIYDVLGKLVHTEPVAAWSQQKRLSQPGLNPRVYHCRLSWGERTGVVRFVKE